MSYQLKKGQESFTPSEGPFAGKSFERGKLYAEIPPEEARRFEKIPEASAPAPDPDPAEKPAKADSKRGSSPSEKGEVKS